MKADDEVDEIWGRPLPPVSQHNEHADGAPLLLTPEARPRRGLSSSKKEHNSTQRPLVAGVQ
ncbi:unnamed protein product, partial [Amoebophrya sp. A25]|eukprot:GSA25T00002559001.1